MKKILLGALIMCLSIGLTGCFKSDANDTKKEEAFKTVRVEVARLKVSDQVLTYSGVVRSEVEKRLSFKSSGRVEKMLVKEGDVVEKGQVLGILDTRDLELQVNSTSSQLLASEKEIAIKKESYDFNADDYNKAKTLYDAGIISKTALDSKSLAHEQARLTYEISKDSYNRLESEKSRLNSFLSDGQVKADQKGRIDQILIEESEFVSPGQPVFLMSSNEKKVTTYVTGADRRQMEIGQDVNLIIDGANLSGLINFIDDSADTKTHSFRVEISIDDSFVTNGSVAGVEFVVGERNGIWIPIQSIQSTTIDFVYLIEEDRASKRAIEILEVKGDDVLINGLEAGEKVVVSGMKSLIEGMLVKASE